MIATVAPGTTRVGWIGIGVMGRSMCGHLLKKGFSVVLNTRTRAKAEDLLAAGATWADSPRAVAEQADVIFTMVGFPADVRQCLLDPGGALEVARQGQVFVDMSTSSPALAREIDAAARAKGAHSIDAPVSGGDIGAREARLSIMIGGEAEVFEALKPIWETIGKTVVRQGDAGAGQHTKAVNQILIATGMIGICEALIYGHRAGLELPRVLESVSSGAAGSWSLSNLAPRMLKGDFEPGFFVEHFLKDLDIALDESRRMGIVLPGLALAEQLYRSVAAHGWARKGTQSLALAVAELSALRWPGG